MTTEGAIGMTTAAATMSASLPGLAMTSGALGGGKIRAQIGVTMLGAVTGTAGGRRTRAAAAV